MASDADDDAEVLLLQGHAFLLLAALRQRIQRKKRKKHRFWVRAIFKELRAQQQQHRSSESWPTQRKWFPLNSRSSLDRHWIVTGSSLDRHDRRDRTSFYLHDCDDPDRHDRDFKENWCFHMIVRIVAYIFCDCDDPHDYMETRLNGRAADVELDMFACGMAWILLLHLFPEDLVGVAVRPFPLISCDVTRGVRVESPIRLFLIQQ